MRQIYDNLVRYATTTNKASRGMRPSNLYFLRKSQSEWRVVPIFGQSVRGGSPVVRAHCRSPQDKKHGCSHTTVAQPTPHVSVQHIVHVCDPPPKPNAPVWRAQRASPRKPPKASSHSCRARSVAAHPPEQTAHE